MRSVIYWLEGWGMTYFRPRFGLGTTHCLPAPLTGSTSAYNNVDCKKDCGLDLQSHVKIGLRVGMQSIWALGLWTWNAILSKRILMMPAAHLTLPWPSGCSPYSSVTIGLLTLHFRGHRAAHLTLP